MQNIKRLVSLSVGFFLLLNTTNGQDDDYDQVTGAETTYRPVQTAVPFLMIAPDSRAAAMGDAGAATQPDVYSMHWNPAKYSFIKDDLGLAVSFTPWLQNLVNDMYLSHINFYYNWDKRQTVAASLRYFTLGDIQFTDEEGNPMTTHNPNQWSVDVAYSRLFSDQFSGSVAFRYIYSNLTGGFSNSGSSTKSAAISFAADVSAYYQNDITIYENNSTLSLGMNISNIGTKISYSRGNDEFVPINLRLGSGLRIQLDQYNELGLALDLNKLLVPTPPEIEDGEIVAGMDPEVSVPVGMIHSFYDAPGIVTEDGSRSVFREELQEIIYNGGIEYWYMDQFAIRFGYFHEHQRKGNRKYFTTGMGLKLNTFGVDFSYLIPLRQQNPLANTVRFSLTFDLG